MLIGEKDFIMHIKIFYQTHLTKKGQWSYINKVFFENDCRKRRNQNESPSVGALDAQKVKWSNRKSDNGFDANKKVKGLKRTIVVHSCKTC